jgi:hypothetical protein
VAALGYLGRQRVPIVSKAPPGPIACALKSRPAKFWMRLRPAGKAAEAVLVPSMKERSSNERARSRISGLQDQW